MRTRRFLFLVVGIGALTLGLGMAGEITGPSGQAAASEHSAKAASDRPADDGHGAQPRVAAEHGRTPLAEKRAMTEAVKKRSFAQGMQVQHIPLPPLQRPDVSQRAAIAVGNSPHSLSSIQPVKTTTGGETTKNLEQPRNLLTASPVLRYPPTNPLQAPAGRGHGPAALGGPSLSNARNNGVLNGTGFVHKP